MALKEIGDYIVKEINRNLEIIRWSEDEKYDQFAKEKVKLLVELLDVIDECEDERTFTAQVKFHQKGVQGAMTGIEDLLKEIEAR